jgi:hypothetical protein
MKSGFFISSLALFCFSMWTRDLFAAESSEGHFMIAIFSPTATGEGGKLR